MEAIFCTLTELFPNVFDRTRGREITSRAVICIVFYVFSLSMVTQVSIAHKELHPMINLINLVCLSLFDRINLRKKLTGKCG